MGRYGRYGEYKDGVFHFWVKDGQSAKAMVAYLNNPKTNQQLVQSLGANAKRSVKFMASVEPEDKPQPQPAPVQRFGPDAEAKPVKQTEPKPAGNITAGA